MNPWKRLLASALLLVTSCGNPSGPDEEVAFYPVSALIRAEAEGIDTLPIAVIRYREGPQGMDTSIVAKADFRRLALQTFSPDITHHPLKGLYKEDVFMDQTLNRAVIRYSTEDPDAEIRLLELTLDPEREKVKSIYQEKQGRSGDTLTTAKAIWTTGRQLQTTLLRQVNGTPLPTEKEKLVWGLNP